MPFTSIPQKIDISRVKQMSCGYYYSVCVTEDGDVFSFGNNDFGLGFGNETECNIPLRLESLKNIDFVVCGWYHTICKSLDNKIYVWGDNQYGN